MFPPDIVYMTAIRFYLVLLICMVLTIQGIAQTKRIDSLHALANRLKGKEKIEVLLEYANSLVAIDYPKAREASIEAQRLSEKFSYDRGKARGLIIQGRNEFSKFNHSETRDLFQQSVIFCQKIKEKDLEGFAWANLGLEFFTAGEPDSAQVFYNRAFELLKDQKNPYYLSFLYLAWSDYYGLQGNNNLQFIYMKKCWTIREKNNLTHYLPYIGTRLASYYINKGDYDTAHNYLNKSQAALGADTINTDEYALILKQRAVVFAKEGHALQAITLSNKAKKFYEENNYSLELANLLIETGSLFKEISNYEAGLKNYFDALKVAELRKFELEKVKALRGIAWIYYDLKDITLAKENLNKSIVLSVQRHFSKEEAGAYNLMGLILLKEGKYQEARIFLRKSLAIRQKANEKVPVATSFFNLGLLHEAEGDLDSALYYQLKGRALEAATNHALGMVYSYTQLGSIYLKSGEFQKAEEFLTKAESLSRKIKAGAVLIQAVGLYRDLLKKEGKIERAFDYAVLHQQLKDSIFNNTLSNRIATVENINQLEHKDNEIQLLNKTKQLQHNELLIQETRIQEQRFIMLFAAVGLVLFSIVTYLLYRNNKQTKRHNSEIQKRNDEITQQSSQLMEAKLIIEKQNKQIHLRNENLEVEIENRTRELVDYNAQLEQFAFISSHNLRAPVARILGLGQLLEFPDKSAADEMAITEGLITTTKEMDKVLADLNAILDIKRQATEIFTHINLDEELEWIRTTIEKQLFETNAILEADFSGVSSIHSVRSYIDSIFFNLVSNAIKYRNPTRQPRINLKSESRGEYVCLIVSDNGLGIDLAQYRDKIFKVHGRVHSHVEGRGLGLYMVKSQAQALDGRVEVESQINVGTTFYVYLKKNSSDNSFHNPPL
jgi:signal transduction histidine kinase